MAAEDFTTYTEYDPSSRLSVTSSTITLNNFRTRDDVGYVYKDFGAEHFDSDFHFEFDVDITVFQDYQDFFVFGLSNNVSKAYQWYGWDGFCGVRFFESASNHRYIELTVHGYCAWYEVNPHGNTYYFTVTRNLALGDYGRVFCYIYSDSDRTTLITTLSRDLIEGVNDNARNKFRYLYGFATREDVRSDAYISAGTISNLTEYTASFSTAPPTTPEPTTLTTPAPPTDAPNPDYENFTSDYTHHLDDDGGSRTPDVEDELDITQHVIDTISWKTHGNGCDGEPAYSDYIYKERPWNSQIALTDEFDLALTDDYSRGGSRAYIWVLASMPGTPAEIEAAGGHYLALRIAGQQEYSRGKLYLYEYTGTTLYSEDTANNPSGGGLTFTHTGWNGMRVRIIPPGLDISYEDAPFGVLEVYSAQVALPSPGSAAYNSCVDSLITPCKTMHIKLKKDYSFSYFMPIASGGITFGCGLRLPLAGNYGQTNITIRNYELAAGGALTAAPPTCPPTTMGPTVAAETIPCCTIIPRTFAPTTELPGTKVIPGFRTCCDFKGQIIIGNLI